MRLEANAPIARSRSRASSTLAVLAMLAVVLSGPSAAAAAGTVTNCASFGDPGTPGDLAWALVGGGTVTFACSGTIFLLLPIVLDQDTVIDATGQSVTLHGAIYSQVMEVDEGVTAELRSITITGGPRGIHNRGGILTLTSSTVSGNWSLGGIYNERGWLTLTNSTVSGNSGDYGGGISNVEGSVTLTNSTVSGNGASSYGGGIYNSAGREGLVTLTNSTVSGNSGDYGGGIYSEGGYLTFTNSIIAQQAHGGNCYIPPGTITSHGYNLDSDGTCSLKAVGDISGGIADLQPLAINPPGATATHALGVNSQALDAIPPGTNGCGTTIATDQRGVERPQGSGCDMGAYEASVPAADTVTISRAIFANVFSALGVAAESSASPEAELYVSVPNCLTDEPMQWRPRAGAYVLLRRVTSCGFLDGQTVTVTSSRGGVATATIK